MMAQASVIFTSPDITCMHCSVAITSGLSLTAGVNQVFVDVAAKTIAIDYDPALITENQLIEKISKLGYTVTA